MLATLRRTADPELAAHLLERACRELRDPATWTDGATARLADGTPCGAEDPRAVCFCAVAALGRVVKVLAADPAERVEAWLLAYETANEAAQRMYGRPLIAVNEQDGHAAVLGVLGAALCALRQPRAPTVAPTTRSDRW